MPRLHVLYGSQTGNAQSIAEDIYAEVASSSIASLQNLNAAKKLHLTEEPLVYIIVCSTTGNGDPPENAESWWRSIKLKATPTDAFKNVHYAVLGLGDTNYDKFAYMGKMIDKRLEELGGHRFLPLHSADEATNMEEVVAQFRGQLKIALGALLSGLEMKPETTDSHQITLEIKPEPEPELAEESKLLQVKQFRVADGILDLVTIARALGIEADIQGPPPANSLPAARSNENSKIYLTRSKPDIVNKGAPGPEGWDSEFPYEAEVLDARWLTAEEFTRSYDWDDSRRVIHMELSLGNSGITYTPGDSIGIRCPNPEDLVAVALNRILASEGIPQNDDEDFEVWEEDRKTTLREFIRYK